MGLGRGEPQFSSSVLGEFMAPQTSPCAERPPGKGYAYAQQFLDLVFQ